MTLVEIREAHAASRAALRRLNLALERAAWEKGREAIRQRVLAGQARRVATAILRVAEQKRDTPPGWGAW